MRVISHSCSNTEIICALGCADLLVGVDEHSDYPPNIVEALPKVGPDLRLDPEKVSALKPDLVIVSDTVPGHAEMIEELQQHQLPLLVIAPRHLSDIPKSIQIIADALHVNARGQQLAAEFTQSLEQNSITSASKGVPKVLVEWWPKPVIVPGQYSWVSQLIDRAGGINPWSKEPVESLPITTEQAIDANPDLIIMSWCGVPEKNYRTDIVRQRVGWQTINALTHHRIYPISEAFIGRPGPRLIEGLKQLRQIIANT